MSTHHGDERSSLPPIPVVLKALKEHQRLCSDRLSAIKGIETRATDLAAEIETLRPKFEATKALRDAKQAEWNLDNAHFYRKQALDDAVTKQAAAAALRKPPKPRW